MPPIEPSIPYGGGAAPDPAAPRRRGAELRAEDRTWAMLAHLLTFAGGWVVPLVILLVHREERTFVARHAKESLNFQITLLIASVALLPTVCIGLGFVLLPALWITALVFVIQAAVRANEGHDHRYPLTLRLVS